MLLKTPDVRLVWNDGKKRRITGIDGNGERRNEIQIVKVSLKS